MNILSLLEGDGIRPKKASGTRGGEYGSPCPGCGGRDRFRSWPEQGEGGRWWCRQCGKSGDLIQYLKEFRGMSYGQACGHLGQTKAPARYRTLRSRTAPCGKATAWTPREVSLPAKQWLEKAGSFVTWAEAELWSGRQGKVIGWLHGRGLTAETVKAVHLGWCPKDFWLERETWGLPADNNERGKPKKLWIPRGLVIPTFRDGQVVRVRIRRPEPESGPRYCFLAGSSAEAMLLGNDLDVVVVVESELDAILLKQEAGDLVDVIALGSAQARPDVYADAKLRRAKRVLVGLDNDEAGAKEAWRWWTRQYRNAKRWPVVDGKDPSEDWQKGGDLRMWITAGLPDGQGYEESADWIRRPKRGRERN